METSVGASLFDRSLRAVQLTTKGRAILNLCEQMLKIREGIFAIAGERLRFAGIFHLGITELVAHTILPKLVTAINSDFPEMILHPEVNLSLNIYDKLESGKLDLAIV